MKRFAITVVGLGFGDEGKGTTVDWLARKFNAKLVVRYNGGAQAGHNVVLNGGRHHTFSQFGSGTFAGAETYLSEHMMVNPISALAEAARLGGNVLDLLTVCREALVTTPYHMAANRLHECIRTNRHGSCGMGIGETMSDALKNPRSALRVKDLLDKEFLKKWLLLQLEEKRETFRGDLTDKLLALPDVQREWNIINGVGFVPSIVAAMHEFARRVSVVDQSWLASELKKDGVVIFEGAQGVLLDQDYGFHPHTTWSKCTLENAHALLDASDIDVFDLGVMRAYHTRHGAGPFPTEDKVTDEEHNKNNTWQQQFRTGALDLVLLRYALDVVGGVDGLMITNVDRLKNLKPAVCDYYEIDGFNVRSFAPTNPDHLMEREAFTKRLEIVQPHIDRLSNTDELMACVNYNAVSAGVGLIASSDGPTAEDKRVLCARVLGELEP